MITLIHQLAHVSSSLHLLLTHPYFLRPYKAPMRQWQAAENIIVHAFMLQECEPKEKQAEAMVFFAKLAETTGEPSGRVIALVRTAVQPAPWGAGYYAVRDEVRENRKKKISCAVWFSSSCFCVEGKGADRLAAMPDCSNVF